MKLLKLSCNNPSFKTIKFKEGLNIIAGLQLSKHSKKSYNGIGKSASLSLLHLMLGSKPDDGKFIKFLKGYGIFTLTFSHNNEQYEVIKDFNDENYILNGEKYTYIKYLRQLDSIFISSKYPLSFRQAFKVFSRKYGGTYYSSPLMQQGTAISEYSQRFVNLVLLGVDTQLVKEKAETKEQIGKLSDAEKIIEDYEKKTSQENIKDIRDTLASLLYKKENFVIAKDYDEQKSIADRLTQEMNSIRNEIHEKSNSLRRKKESIEEISLVVIDNKKLRDIYEEAHFFLPDQIIRRLDEAQEFHKKLITGSNKRLEREIEVLNSEINISSEALNHLELERDRIIKKLDTEGALEEYYLLIDRIKETEAKIAEYDSYKNMTTKLKKERSALEVKNSVINEKSIIYIAESEKDIEKKESIFRSLVKRFYENSGGSLELKETKDAKYLYDIDIQIPKENSQGVSEVKIYCYDMLLYLLNRDLFNFVAHDGCIFSEMDPRQKTMIIKIAIELANKYNLQYFINMNQNTLKEILENKGLTDAETKIIEESQILKLFDKDPKSWLFGEEF